MFRSALYSNCTALQARLLYTLLCIYRRSKQTAVCITLLQSYIQQQQQIHLLVNKSFADARLAFTTRESERSNAYRIANDRRRIHVADQLKLSAKQEKEMQRHSERRKSSASATSTAVAAASKPATTTVTTSTKTTKTFASPVRAMFFPDVKLKQHANSDRGKVVSVESNTVTHTEPAEESQAEEKNESQSKTQCH